MRSEARSGSLKAFTFRADVIRLWRYYRKQILIGMAVQLQYRFAMVLWVVGNMVTPVIYLAVWQAASAANNGEIAGYSTAGFAGYYIALLIVDHFTNTWALWTVESLIQRGELSGYLLRAFNPIHAEAARHIAFKFMMIAATVPAVLLLALIFRPELAPPLWSLLAFVPVIALASVLSFLFAWLVSLSAFWLVRVNAIGRVYLLAAMFLSGRVAPLDVLPEALRVVADVMPFRWMVAFPVELLLGRLTPAETVLGMGAQLCWLVVAFMLCIRIWQNGIRRYEAVGG